MDLGSPSQRQILKEYEQSKRIVCGRSSQSKNSKVIGQPSRREDIKSWQQAFEEGRHLKAALTIHQGVRIDCKRMIVIPTRGVGNKRL
jgi:hypothetical protein